MAGPSLDSLPSELQLIIFGFAYADCHINITAHKKDSIVASAANRHQYTLLSKASHAAAWQAYLTSATWSFASMTAASTFIASPARSAMLRHIQHIQIDAKDTDPTRLLRLLSHAGCTTLRSVKLINCTAFDFDEKLPEPAATGVLSAMQRDEDEVLQHVLRRSCRAVDVRMLSQDELEGCGVVMALAGMPSLERVEVRAECEVCHEYGTECDWGLVARKVELCVLQAVGERGRASWARERSIARIEKEVRALEDAVLARDGVEGIDGSCGRDWEVELESGEELAVLVG